MAKTNEQPVPVAVAPIKLKKDAKRADRSGRDNNEPGSSREIETEIYEGYEDDEGTGTSPLRGEVEGTGLFSGAQ